jgi:polo-like kinase 1
MYTLLYGRPPFETSDVKKTYKKIKECQYTFNDAISVSFNAKNLISRALVLDPSKRITLDQILNHPFMTSNKIPKQLPSSILSEPLSKSFIDQYITNSQNHSLSKYNSNTITKTIEQKP